MDKLKLVIATLIVAAAVGGFYYYNDESVLMQMVSLLVGVILAIAVAYRTDLGARSHGFIKETQIEIRKVVWPTRKETVQTTLVVFAVVVIIAIILWIFDMFLLWGVKYFTGQGG